MKRTINKVNRRTALKTYSFALFGLSLPGFALANNSFIRSIGPSNDENIPKHFPNIDPEIIAEVVGKSHFDLDGVKEMQKKDLNFQGPFGSGVSETLNRQLVQLLMLAEGT